MLQPPQQPPAVPLGRLLQAVKIYYVVAGKTGGGGGEERTRLGPQKYVRTLSRVFV